MKYIYRVIILLGVFVAAIFYFSRDIKEVVFHINNTTEMGQTTFPLVSINTENENINQLHGYSSNLNANTVREAVTPVNQDQTFEVVIDQKDYDIKKLNYEVREFVGNELIESDSISVFNEEENLKTAKIKFNSELKSWKEYAVKLTLITSDSQKMYFYFALKVCDESYLKEKLDFVLNFHNDILDKKTAEKVIPYLEPLNNVDNSSLANVNIHSSFDLVSFGGLNPTIITDIIPKVKEIYSDTAVIELDYAATSEASGTLEYYMVKEFYRVRYTSDRMRLLNYERKMETQFDTKLASLANNTLKLGISPDNYLSYLSSADNKKLSFIWNRELWFYDLEKNHMTKVFSFRQKDTDYIRDIYDQHNIKLLNMDAEGNINFLVYGYINRGQYEGKVALILYRFIKAENRIEELVYIPMEEPYQTLKENIGELSYLNAKETFYFYLNNNIYSYNLITREMKILANNIPKNNMVDLKELGYIAWQENNDPLQSKNILIYNLESDDKKTITAPAGYNIRLMDMIDNNIIYGFYKADNVMEAMDGSAITPLEQIEIASAKDNNILKKYSEKGFYVTDLAVKDNIIELNRISISGNNGQLTYQPAAPDYIMNQEVKKSPVIEVISSNNNEKTLTEFYLKLPLGFAMSSLPKVSNTSNTVISEDPTLRLDRAESDTVYYYPYVMGGIEGVYTKPADAIKVADEKMGTVLDSNYNIIWERGVKSAQNTIGEIERLSNNISLSQGTKSLIRLMLSYQGVAVKDEMFQDEAQTAYDILKKYSKYRPVCLTGITLEEAYYYISRNIPVIAMTNQKDAVLIYGYDAFNVIMVDPKQGNAVKRGIQDCSNILNEAGNVFLTYLPE